MSIHPGVLHEGTWFMVERYQSYGLDKRTLMRADVLPGQAGWCWVPVASIEVPEGQSETASLIFLMEAAALPHHKALSLYNGVVEEILDGDFPMDDFSKNVKDRNSL